MILYLDTSTLVKLYVHEPGSEEVRKLVEEAELVAASVVAYPEARAALARRRRERGLTPAEHRRARAALDADWPRILMLDVSEPLARRAGDLAERHRLRGFDALHLATYVTLSEEFRGDDVRFSAADQALVTGPRAGQSLEPGSGDGGRTAWSKATRACLSCLRRRPEMEGILPRRARYATTWSSGAVSRSFWEVRHPHDQGVAAHRLRELGRRWRKVRRRPASAPEPFCHSPGSKTLSGFWRATGEFALYPNENHSMGNPRIR